MAKNRIKKKSKRQPARLRYKIEKKVRQHNKKLRREAKKNPKKNKPEIIQVPNICPFKEDILKDVELYKKHKEEEKKRMRETLKLEKQKEKEEQKKLQAKEGLEGLANAAENRGTIFNNLFVNAEKILEKSNDNSVKQFYKEFRKVIEAADVIVEVVDARDPLGTRCKQVEQTVNEVRGNKRLILVLNKADLVPRNILDKWLKYFKRRVPTIPFKASTQMQSRKLGQRKFNASDKGFEGSSSVGTDLLLSLLNNYCRNKDIKTSISVGIVGLPNVGKSSIINSLKRNKACNTGATPGVTKSVQEVQLDSKIKLLDSPGIVFSQGSDSNAILRNAIRVSSIGDPITPANTILQRVSKSQMMEMYDITDYDSPEEFYKLKATRQGRFKKGGIPDLDAAARGLLEDWNSGKIKYYTVPPEENENVHISASIVTESAKEFDLEKFEVMEVETLNKIEKGCTDSGNPIEVESLGEIESLEKMEEDTKPDSEGTRVKVSLSKGKKKSSDGKDEKAKVDPEMLLEGNQKLNKLKKVQFKKEKKDRMRREKVAKQLSAGLENFSLTTDNSQSENYNFDEDFPENVN